MKGSMKDHAVEFGFKGRSDGFGVVPDAVNTDIDFAQGGGTGRQIERDDVCVIVVFQVLPVDFKKPLVAAEDIIEGLQFLSFFTEQRFDLSFQGGPVFQCKTLGFEEETNF